MFKAIQTGDYELVSYYLQIGVDPNYQHPEYMAAPLIESIRFNQLKIAKLLLENGAEANIKEDWAGETPLSVAKLKKNEAATKLLKAYL
ncbi:MAG: ankyrin repeat domain-containing protein, partial [Bacteroidota bacterium]